MTDMPRLSLLVALAISGIACPAHARELQGLFDGLFGSDSPPPPPPLNPNYVRPIYTYNPMTATTAYALQYALAGQSGKKAAQTVPISVPGGGSGSVALFSPVEGDLVLSFSTGGASLDGGQPKAVPFLRPFVYTAAGPGQLVDAFASLLAGGGTAADGGPLADAVEAVTGGQGQQLRLVTCTGGDQGGLQLAVLCGPWAALAYPRANVDVVTFGTAWSSAYNPPFSWAWQQLVTLHYLWPFELAAVQLNSSTPGGDPWPAFAQAVNPLITADALDQAIQVPGLPAAVPPGSENWSPGDPLGELGPAVDLEEEYQLPESDCPVVICKTREALALSCLGFGKAEDYGVELFQDMPSLTLNDPVTDGDAVVTWNESTATLYLLFKYTESRADWLIDAQAFQTEEFPQSIEPYSQAPAGDRLSDLVPNVEVHTGFYKQFKALAIEPLEGVTGAGCVGDVPLSLLLEAACNLTAGATPLRVVSSGFSLGGALSELAGVWAAQIWPSADITVANQGCPIVGDDNFVKLAQATYGRGYKYVYRLDEVPSIPPLPDYQQTQSGIWIMEQGGATSVLLQDRPDTSIFDTTWSDHTCDIWTDPDTGEVITGYVPQLFNATRVAVPAWVYNATAA